MQPQEFILPNNPLETISDDYQWAEIRLIWNWNTRTSAEGGQVGHLLFATVQLLPYEYPKPIIDEEVKIEKVGDHELNVVRIIKNAEDAVAFYRGFNDHSNMKYDIGKYSIRDRILQISVLLPTYGEEPAWPSLVTVGTEPKKDVPFLQTSLECPRMHHLMPIDFDWKMIWQRKCDSQKIGDIFANIASFDPTEFPDYWGSAHLIAPNPIVREHRCKLIPSASGETNEGVNLVLTRRSNKQNEPLYLDFSEVRATGETIRCSELLTSPVVNIRFPSHVHAFSHCLRCPKRGVLYWSKPYTFVKQIGIHVDMITAIRKIHPQFDEPFEVQAITPDREINVGSPSLIPIALHRLLTMKRLRKQIREGRKLNQRYYYEKREDARRDVHELLKRAKSEVIFIDPYFVEPDDFLNFVMSVQNVKASVTVMNSADVLKGKAASGSQDAIPLLARMLGNKRIGEGHILSRLLKLLGYNQKATIDKSQILHKEIAHWADLAKKGEINDIHVKVMSGNPPPIHDRFLIIDDDIWHIGASFNGLGKHGTMIVKLPHPRPVMSELQEALSNATDFNEWFEKRQQFREK